MRKLIFWPIFLAAVFYGAFKLFVWLSVQEQINTLKQNLALTAALDSGWVESDLDGTVRIRDIRITPYLLRTTLSIKSVTLRFPSAWALLSAASRLEQGYLPERLHITIEGGEWPVRVYRQDIKNEATGALNVLAFPRPCGTIHFPESAAWLGMGYGVLGFGGDIGWQFDEIDRVLKLDAEATVDGVSRVHLQAETQLDHDLILPWPAGRKPPRVIHLELDVADLGLEKRLNRMCAGQTGQSEGALIDAATTRIRQAAAELGITLGAGWLEASRQWMQGDSDLRVILDPLPDFEPNMVKLISADSVLDALGFKLYVNGRHYPDLALKVDMDQLRQQMAPPETPQSDAEKQPPSSNMQPAPARPDRQWVELDVDGVDDTRIGLPARIVLHSGKQLEGRLARVEPYVFELKKNVAGGEVGYTVKKVEIQSLALYMKVQP